MSITVLRTLAILCLCLCLSTQHPIAAPASAQIAKTKPAGAPFAIDINALFQHWVHSSEEDSSQGSVQTFRPAASMMFPPSRFRMAYKFARNGSCEFYFLSPDDAHHLKICKWTGNANDTSILRIVANGRTTTFRIVELSSRILRIEPLDLQ
jgi:hypothetical protein